MRLIAGLLLLAAVDASAQPAGRSFSGGGPLVIMAPAAPGGGWDQTARAMRRVLAAIEPGASVQVENVPGAAGTIGLARFAQSERQGPKNERHIRLLDKVDLRDQNIPVEAFPVPREQVERLMAAK